MKNNKIFLTLLVIAIIIMPNIAKASNFTNDNLLKIESDLRTENVAEEDIKILIDKLENNELWDSMKEEYQDLKPQIIEDNYTKTIYPDGSFMINETIDKTPISEKYKRAIIRTNSVTIKKNLVFVGASFDMDYERNTSTNQARILSQYNKNVWTIGGTYSNLQSGYWSGWRSPTNAWMSFDLKLGIGDIGAASLGWIKGYANGSGHWMEYQ